MPSRGTARKKTPQKHIHKFRRSTVTAAQNGGYTVEHSPQQDDGPGYTPDETHAFSNAADMHAHMQSVYPAGKRANLREPGEQS
jgi:hypothetical protein